MRLERHTSNLADEQSRRLDRLDDRVRLDLRVVDEHLLAISRATADLDATRPASRVAVLAEVGDGMALIAPPGAMLGPVPTGYRVAAVTSFTLGDDGMWRAVEGDGRTDLLRIAQLAPSP